MRMPRCTKKIKHDYRIKVPTFPDEKRKHEQAELLLSLRPVLRSGDAHQLRPGGLAALSPEQPQDFQRRRDRVRREALLGGDAAARPRQLDAQGELEPRGLPRARALRPDAAV